MTNGLSVRNQEDFKELYKEDAPLAMSLLFQNLSDIKSAQAEHIKNHSKQFSAQVAICSSQFVKKSHVVIIGALALGIGLGAGWLTVNEVLALVK